MVTLHWTKHRANYRYIDINTPISVILPTLVIVCSCCWDTEPSKCASISLANHFAPQDQVNQRCESDTATENTGEQGGLRSSYYRWKPGYSADTSWVIPNFSQHHLKILLQFNQKYLLICAFSYLLRWIVINRVLLCSSLPPPSSKMAPICTDLVPMGTNHLWVCSATYRGNPYILAGSFKWCSYCPFISDYKCILFDCPNIFLTKWTPTVVY